MLTTYYSNRLENLAERLAALVRQPLRSPFEPEIVVVQSNGMARWLSLQLAARLGICANLRFPFPGALLWELIRRVLGDEVPAVSAFDSGALAWRVMHQLSELDSDPAVFPALQEYLRGGDDFRRFELACRIAGVFDQYLVYRPDWIAAWEDGGQDHWQARLWRRLVAADDVHRVRLQRRFARLLEAGGVDRAALPPRFSLIGISSLPPVYLEIMALLGRYLDVHLFMLNPCREYWGDIVAERDIARRGAEVDAEAQYLEVGNPLLGSLGKQSRDLIDQIQNHDALVVEDFTEPGEESLLACLQSDILDLRNRGGPGCPATVVALNDRSVQVHACHGPLREIEVLYDQLLDRLQENPDLQPSDIIVMTPDIETYGPYVEAVFGTAEGERRIPYGIADQGIRAESPVIDVCFRILDMRGSRYGADQVLNLLESPSVRHSFGISEDDLSLLYRWVRESGIRWGIDRDNRLELALPATGEHSWRSGLDRLLLGYALPGDDRRMLSDILPYDEVEGIDAQLVGRLRTFAEAVFELETELAGERTLADWKRVLTEVLGRFLAPAKGEEREAALIRTALDTMVESGQRAGFSKSVPLEVIKSSLRRQLDMPEAHSGRFLSGGVTFCAMVPMRSIPFEVVCLIGMNDGGYPRPQRSLGFDLMARHPRRGDRSRRNDDRYLFLEALLSARRCFYLSYQGNDIHDNSIIPPSVLVSELLDTIVRGFRDAAGGEDIVDQIVTRHPLQPFSHRYFTGDPKLFSYSRHLAEASRLTGRGEGMPGPLIAGELPEPDDEWRRVEYGQLIGFLVNPSRYLLRQRLGIELEQDTEILKTREPFILDALERYGLRSRMLSLRLEGMAATSAWGVLQGSGMLPHGQVGECVFQREWEDIERFAGRIVKKLPKIRLDPLEVDLPLGGLSLTGWLAGVSPLGLMAYRPATVKAADYLELWVRHLLLNALAPEGVSCASHWLGTDQEVILNPVTAPLDCLQHLLECYWRGLRRPLPFFPKSAWAYVQALDKGRNSAELAARAAWEGNEFNGWPGEGDNVYHQLAHRGGEPLGDEFADLAVSIFGPLLEHREKAS